MRPVISIYRISDFSNPEKIKPDYASKENCLKIFEREFGKDNLIIVCDNVTKETFEMTQKYAHQENIFVTSNGNTEAFLYSWRTAHGLTDRVPDDTIFYFVEDDYIHREGSKRVLIEAFDDLNAEYVSLYDHPDKYQNFKDEKFVWDHGKIDIDEDGIRKPKHIFLKLDGEIKRKAELFISKSTHWRTVDSTTMTFATTAKHILEDNDKMIKLHTGKHLPMRGDTFRMLASKGKQLISPIPSYSAHAEEKWLPYFINWKKQAYEK